MDAEVRALWGLMTGKVSAFARPKNRRVEASDIDAVVDRVDEVLDDARYLTWLIPWLVESLNSRGITPAALKKRVRRRWLAVGRPGLREFAPYAHYCARVRLLYLVGHEVWPKKRELNDLGDLEYLHLLPFTGTFAANDVFVRAMASRLLRPDQVLTCSCKLEKEVIGTSKNEARCHADHG